MVNLTLRGFHGYLRLLEGVETVEVSLALTAHVHRSTEHSLEAVQPDEACLASRHHPGVAAKVWTETNLKRREMITFINNNKNNKLN